MNERLVPMSDDELGAALASLELAWPETPDTSAPVAETLRALERDPRLPRPRPPRIRSRRRRVILLVAAVLLTLAAAAAAAKFAIDLGAVVIRDNPGPPAPLPTQTLEPADLGTPVSLERAGEIAGFDPIVPPGLGSPDLVWAYSAVTAYDPVARSTVVVMAWRPGDGLPRIRGARWGALLFEFHGDVEVAAKLLSAEGDVHPLGVPFAYRLTTPHELDLLTPSGLRRVRVDGTVILWQAQDLILRLETALSTDESAALVDL